MRRPIFFVSLMAILAASAAVGMMAGGVVLSPAEIARGEPRALIHLHLGRVALGIAAGAGLAVAGAIFQAVLRNPLADPFILGTSSGGGLGAALAIVLGGGTLSLAPAAFLGAMASTAVVHALARVRGRTTIHTLLLAGVIVSSVLNSALIFIVSTSRVEAVHGVIWWMLGNLQAWDWNHLGLVAGAVAAGGVLAAAFAPQLNALTLGDEAAAHLGVGVERARWGFFALGSLITGAVVSACGIIAFLGMAVPHLARMALGPDHRALIPASALAGAVLMVTADSLAQTVLAPATVPVGVVTAFLGGPFFLHLLRRRRRESWG